MPGLLRSTKALLEQLPAFGGGREGVALPFQFIFDGSDGLRLCVFTSKPGLTVRLAARWLESGTDEVQVLTYDFAPNTSGGYEYFHIRLGRGVLLNVLVIAMGTIVVRGQCHVRLDVERGAGAHVTLGTLLAGYIDSSGGRAWPGSPLESAVEGPGYIHAVSSAVPAAGGLPFVLVPLATRWRVLSVTADLTTSGAAGTRRPYILLRQDNAIVYIGPSSLAQAPALAVSHAFAPGAGQPENTGAIIGLGGLPDPAVLQNQDAATANVALGTNGLLAGDQWTALNVLVEEWLSPVTVEGS